MRKEEEGGEVELAIQSFGPSLKLVMEFVYEARVNHIAKRNKKKEWEVAFAAQRSWLGHSIYSRMYDSTTLER